MGERSGPQMGDTDSLVLLLVGVGAVVFAASHIDTVSAAAMSWLLEHHVLVTAAESLLTLPGLDAGVDVRRVVLAAGVLTLVVTGWLGARRRRSAVL